MLPQFKVVSNLGWPGHQAPSCCSGDPSGSGGTSQVGGSRAWE